MFQTHQWRRDARNPILAPGGTFDAVRCMNPHIVSRGDEYLMFYGGGAKNGQHKVCLAIASKNDMGNWRKLGPVLELGTPGSFDSTMNVMPVVHKFRDLWHLYYTSNNGGGNGLQSYTGIGLATSRDLVRWERWGDEPVLKGDGFPQFGDNKGIGGGGPIIETRDGEGNVLYRMYYTLSTGRPDPDIFIRGSKHSALAESHDGISWFNKRIVMTARPDAPYENVATIGLNVWKTAKQFRAIYAAIGTQFNGYSICEAVSPDGLNWERGAPGENLALPPQGDGWESKMTCYPFVLEEDDHLRLFYCGNGSGATGIGTAIAEKLD